MTEKIEPCDVCGAECESMHGSDIGVEYWWVGHDSDCKTYETEEEAIAAHNERCHLVHLGQKAVHVRETCAAFARVLLKYGLLDEAINEARAAGVPDGFGKELDDQIREAKGKGRKLPGFDDVLGIFKE